MFYYTLKITIIKTNLLLITAMEYRRMSYRTVADGSGLYGPGGG